jgi:protein-S-isoprenylcysteine O-methyltransferase Ste14
MKNYILPAVQFVLLLVIIFYSGAFYITSVSFVLIQMVSLLIIFWAILAKRIYKIPASRISHRKGIYFLKDGPYEFIRHPIYTGLLLYASSYVQQSLSLEGSLAFIVFAGIIVLRAGHDERVNEVYFKHHYSEYKKVTKKLIPYIY